MDWDPDRAVEVPPRTGIHAYGKAPLPWAAMARRHGFLLGARPVRQLRLAGGHANETCCELRMLQGCLL